MNKAAEEAFFRDGGRTTVDETLPADKVIPAAAVTPVSVKSAS
jgi:chemotaxis protein MotB